MKKLLKPILNHMENGYLLNGEECFDRNFHKAMSFHWPEGLAAVSDDSGAYHIKADGTSLYEERYDETFGFYDGVATVNKSGKFFHIDTKGKRIHNNSFVWSGNFQDRCCVVRDAKGFFHIGQDGKEKYRERYEYAGDFRYGTAVVYKNGKAFHILEEGTLLHNKTFISADVFHKGYAVVEDSYGFYHIDKSGRPKHNHRFLSAEPFYNGVSLCKTKKNKLIRLFENGHFEHLPVISPDIDAEEIKKRIENGEKVAMVLRHATRDNIPEGTWGMDIDLNEKGYQMSEKFGKLLQETGDWNYFSSPVRRCVNTCISFSKGQNNGTTDIVLNKLLGEPGAFTDPDNKINWQPEDFGRIAEKYIHDGIYEGFRPLSVGCELIISLVENSINNLPVLMITHDFFVAGLFKYLGLHHPELNDWVQYLDGVVFFSDGEKITEWRRFNGMEVL